MSRSRWIVAVALLALLAAPLTACGKKARSLDPADGGESGYPRQYPAPR